MDAAGADGHSGGGRCGRPQLRLLALREARRAGGPAQRRSDSRLLPNINLRK